jgi:hypothetical protein
VSAYRQQRRQRLLGAVWLVGLSTLGLAAALSTVQLRAARPDTGRPVLAGLQQAASEAAAIRVRLPEGGFTLTRTPAGWVMAERGNQPARTAAVEELLSALAGLHDGQLRTADPALFDQLAVANPEDFGNGARVTITSRTGAGMADVLVGQRGATFYLRQAGETKVFRGSGRFPDLRQPAAWLDLDFPPVDPELIARLDSTRGDSTYAIVRRVDGGFAPALASGEPAPSGNANATAAVLAISGFQPEDVRPVAQGPERRLASHVWQLRDGRTIGFDVLEIGAAGGWVETSASAPPGSPEALRTWVRDWNERSAGRAWFLRAPVLASFLLTKEQVETGPGATPDSGPG